MKSIITGVIAVATLFVIVAEAQNSRRPSTPTKSNQQEQSASARSERPAVRTTRPPYESDDADAYHRDFVDDQLYDSCRDAAQDESLGKDDVDPTCSEMCDMFAYDWCTC